MLDPKTKKRLESAPQIIRLICDRATEYSAKYILAQAEDMLGVEGSRMRGRDPFDALADSVDVCVDACGDGRVSPARKLGIRPWNVLMLRDFGCGTRLTWPWVTARVDGWVHHSWKHARRPLILGNFHYSAGAVERGCAGCNCDIAESMRHPREFCESVRRVYRQDVDAVLVGIETDDGAVEIYDQADQRIISGADCGHLQPAEIAAALERSLPMIDPRSHAALGRMLAFNARFVAERRRDNLPHTELEHNERVFACGWGFDFLTQHPNWALTKQPGNPDRQKGVRTAAILLWQNIQDTVAGDDACVVVSIPYGEPDTVDERLALEIARDLLREALDDLQQVHPKLYQSGRLHFVVGTKNLQTRRFTPFAWGTCGDRNSIEPSEPR